MADPRATKISAVGVGLKARTFKIDASTIVYDGTLAGGSAGYGLAVTESANGIVALAADADTIVGQLGQVASDGACTVYTGGTVELPGGTAATLTPGTKIVGALLGAAKGYIRSVAAATLAEVAKARHNIQDATDATAVQVLLDG